jgi:hypothetical protein
MKPIHNIRQCGRLCHCIEYLNFKKIKEFQFYIKCYNKIIDKGKFYNKFENKSYKIKNSK